MNAITLKIILQNITFPGLVFDYVPKDALMFIRVRCPGGVCNTTGERKPWTGRKWYISPHMTESEVVGTCLLAVKTAQEHELREQFRYCGESIYGPHWSVRRLVNLCPEAHTDERAETDGGVPDLVGDVSRLEPSAHGP